MRLRHQDVDAASDRAADSESVDEASRCFRPVDNTQEPLAPRALQREPRALVPRLFCLDRLDHKFTGYPRDGGT